MIRIVQDDILAARILRQNGVAVVPPYSGLVGYDGDGRVRGAIIVSHFDGTDAELSIVGAPGFCTPKSAREVMRYLFDALACRRVSSRTLRSNREARRGLKTLGFRQEGVKRDGIDRRSDVMLYGMLRDECRILRRA